MFAQLRRRACHISLGMLSNLFLLSLRLSIVTRTDRHTTMPPHGSGITAKTENNSVEAEPRSRRTPRSSKNSNNPRRRSFPRDNDSILLTLIPVGAITPRRAATLGPLVLGVYGERVFPRREYEKNGRRTTKTPTTTLGLIPRFLEGCREAPPKGVRKNFRAGGADFMGYTTSAVAILV